MRKAIAVLFVGFGVLVLILAVSAIVSSTGTSTSSAGLADSQNDVSAAKSTAKKVKSWGDGLYEIGSDIPAGTFKSKGGDSCYWEIDSSNSNIARNHYGSGPEVVTIKSGDKTFSSAGCGHWVRQVKK